jgi:hypothetical protein
MFTGVFTKWVKPKNMNGFQYLHFLLEIRNVSFPHKLIDFRKMPTHRSQPTNKLA